MIHRLAGGCATMYVVPNGRAEYITAALISAVADSVDEAQIAAEAIGEGHVACGWAFDCGVREAERDAAAVAADRARIAQAIQDELDSEIEGGSTRIVLLLERLLRVVEGG